MAGKENGKRRKSWVKLRTVLYNSTNALTLSSKSMTKPQPRTQLIIHKYDVDSLSLVRTVLHRIILFNPSWNSVWISFVMVWANFSPNYLLSSHSSVYFNKLHSNTSSGSAHSKSKSQTKNIRTTWNSIDPNGYSMGSKSNIQTSWNSSHNTHRCMLWGRRKQEENLRLLVETIKNWFHILYQRCTIHLNYIIVQKCVTRYQENKWNHLNIQMSESLTSCSNDSPLYSNILHPTNTFSSKSQQQHFFPFVTFSSSAPSQG